MFFDLIANRRSIRNFQDKVVEEEKIKFLEKALLYSPSSKNKEPWEFIFVQNKIILEGLSKVKSHGASFLKQVGLAVAVCADTSLTDVWVEDLSICGSYLLLAAEELGLGACWVQIRNREDDYGKSASFNVKEILHIPSQLEVGLIIGIGYAKEKREPKEESSLSHNKIHRESY